MNGRTKPYFFAFETKKKPGILIGHFIRVETLELPKDRAESTEFTLMGADCETDKRVLDMLQCAHSFIENNPQFKRKKKDE